MCEFLGNVLSLGRSLAFLYANFERTGMTSVGEIIFLNMPEIPGRGTSTEDEGGALSAILKKTEVVDSLKYEYYNWQPLHTS